MKTLTQFINYLEDTMILNQGYVSGLVHDLATCMIYWDNDKFVNDFVSFCENHNIDIDSDTGIKDIADFAKYEVELPEEEVETIYNELLAMHYTRKVEKQNAENLSK